MPLCVHAFVFTDVLVHVCMQEQIHTDACTWRPGVNTALPRLLSPCVLRLGLSLKRLSRLADRGVPGMPLTLRLQYFNYQQARPCLVFFTWVLGIKFRFSCLHGGHFIDLTISATQISGFSGTPPRLIEHEWLKALRWGELTASFASLVRDYKA